MTEEKGMRNYEFLIDIDEFRATYRVGFALYGNQGFYEIPLVECPHPDQMKYADTYCIGEKTSTMSVALGAELPYEFQSETGGVARVTRSVDDERGEYLNVRVNNCGNGESASGANVNGASDGASEMSVNGANVAKITKEVLGWARGLGLELEDDMIKVTEVCDGEV